MWVVDKIKKYIHYLKCLFNKIKYNVQNRASFYSSTIIIVLIMRAILGVAGAEWND